MYKSIRDPELIAEIHRQTATGLSAEKIAQQLKKMTAGGFLPRGNQIEHVWSLYGGKEAFVQEISRRITAGLPLVDCRPKQSDLLTDEELLRLGNLMLKRFSMTQALVEMGKPISEGRVRHFINVKTKYGSLPGLLDHCVRERSVNQAK